MIDLEERIALVKSMKEFAIGLGIPRDGSFEKLEEYTTIYSLTVSRRDRVESPFLDNPRGIFYYYGQEEAKAAQQQYEQDGLDTHLREIRTSGPSYEGDYCPLTEALLQEDLVDLTIDVFHELFHVKALMEGRAALSMIEEPMACIFSDKAAALFHHKEGNLLAEIKEWVDWEPLFNTKVVEYLKKLKMAYGVSEENGRIVLKQAGEEYKYFKGSNNAYFLVYSAYCSYAHEAAKVLTNLSPGEILGGFKRWYREIQALTGFPDGVEMEKGYACLLFGQNLIKRGLGHINRLCEDIGFFRNFQLLPNGLALPTFKIKDNLLNLGDDAYIVLDGKRWPFFEVKGTESQMGGIIFSQLLQTAKSVSQIRDDESPYAWVHSMRGDRNLTLP